MRNTKSQEKSIQSEQLMVAGGQIIEISPDELRAVVGGRPTVEITVKPDGTIVIVQK